MPVWINEFHYDDAGTDTGEFIEIAGTAGTDLTGWTIVRYNGANGQSYASPGAIPTLSGTIPDSGNGFGFLSFGLPQDGLQNGAPDGIALVNNTGTVVLFISYEGTFTATNGPAAGMTSVDVGAGILENGGADGTSIALTGSGTQYSDFTWAIAADDTPGAQNVGQSFGGVTPPSVSIADVTRSEGDAGTTLFTFTVTRTGGSGAFSVNYQTADGTALAGSDYASTSGTLTFVANDNSETFTVAVSGDTSVEGDETFLVNLGGATGGAVLADGQATGTITNDDAPPPPPTTPWINEFHYDNVGADAGEFIEIAGPAGFDLSGYSLLLYNGNGGVVYNTRLLTGVIPDQGGGSGVLSFAYPSNGIQNGGSPTEATDGIALVGPGGVVIEFISYEGVLTPVAGPAAGMTSVDVGVFEGASQPLGSSIARVGAGFQGLDFTWVLQDANTSGAPNTGQSFVAPTARVRVGDVSVTEGDAGTQFLTFTVTRSGLQHPFSVSYATADGTASVGSDYVAVSGVLDFAQGEMSKTVTVTVNGDTNFEPSETFFLNLSAPTNGATIGDGQAVGRILNDDIAFLRIFEIQGAGHTSPVEGADVRTTGVVTAVDSNGFWIQDATGDGNTATSDAIFVLTNTAPGVAVGASVNVSGRVAEALPQNNPNNLTTTQIGNAVVTAGPAAGPITAVVLDNVPGGRLPPTSVIDDDGNTTYDPATDGLDFYESLEGMLVTIPNARATDLSDGGLTWVVGDNGADATGVNARGGITIGATDFNPERIGVFIDSGVLPGLTPPAYDMGDSLGNVTGVVSYFGGNYEVVATSIGNTVPGGSNADEVSALTGDATHLTIAAYNLENLDPTDSADKFATLANDIVAGLRSPDIIGVEEIQDADGSGGGANLSGQASAQRLIDAITAAGGPTYVYIEIAPTTPGSTGGEGGGNIRNGFLYNPERVTYVEGSAELIDGPAFSGSRRPLSAEFTFRGETVTVIDVHSTSRIGSEQLFGDHQPPINAGDAARIAQSEAVRAYVLALQAADPDAHVAVMGDFNAFQFEQSLTLLEGGGSLVNLSSLLPAQERWSYVFEGNAQQIDHLLVSQSLFETAQFDVVHLNAGVSGFRGTDHDAVLGRFEVNTGPTAVNDAATVLENQSVTIDVLANDEDPNTGDDGTIVSVSATARGAGVSIVGNQVVYTADVPEFDLLAPGETTTDTFTYVMRDAGGETSTATVTVTVTGAPDGPTQNGGNGQDTLTGTAADERLNGENGSDRLLGGAGADSLYGGNGQDELIGGAGIDLLVGGLGGDRFIFDGAFGHDTVADFGPGDRIVLDDAQFANFADVLAHAAQDGGDVVITLDAANSITLADVQLSALKANDFLFA